LNNALRKITNNNTFRTKKIKISEDKKLKTYEYVKHVYELIGKNKQVLDWKTFLSPVQTMTAIII
jgi:hypothetical protein